MTALIACYEGKKENRKTVFWQGCLFDPQKTAFTEDQNLAVRFLEESDAERVRSQIWKMNPDVFVMAI
jgi:hypothetical protein